MQPHVGGIEIHLVGEGVSERAQRRFRGRIRRVAGEGEEGEEGGGEDEVSRGSSGLGRGQRRLFGGRLEPGIQGRVRHVCSGEVIAVHHVAELGDGGINENGWVGAAGATPNDVRWETVVDGRGFGDNSLGLGGDGQVAGDVVEGLFLGEGTLLDMVSHASFVPIRDLGVSQSGRTEMDWVASLSFSRSRATMIMLAPFAASWRATLRPIPLEPPVIKTVYMESPHQLAQKGHGDGEGVFTLLSTGN